jgi:hypothetical protein
LALLGIKKRGDGVQVSVTLSAPVITLRDCFFAGLFLMITPRERERA